ncbi:MFS transporter [Pandoraea sputorum]|uniref:MFS transporter n=1 Tax=Pandoraea sputorum TaxID=93222 RepID=A0A239SF64_9BURK|nr:MFS transporter [Pandoraea sputorum]SNU83303.1 Proline porter II [Pandoraea sputorum]VVE17043.1 MFS transporter [Pandoraea sputorum]VVE80276.1 MFS transporter [Pandoraea sputorum]
MNSSAAAAGADQAEGTHDANVTASARSDVPVYKLIVATSIGNALEWYDLIVYGYFAVTISKLFFPAHDETVSLLMALGTFALSYLARPLGAFVLGAYADRHGRRASLMLSIAMMTVGTGIIAFMPTYAVIGVWAPIGIFLSRLMQGFSAGGEFGSSTAFLVEHVPNRPGFMSSWQFASQGASTLLASAFGAVLTGALTQPQLESWGWRIPFLFGMLVGPIGLYIRKYVDETPAFANDVARKKAASAEGGDAGKSPVWEVLATQKSRLLVSIGALILTTTANYMILYMPTYATKQLGLPPAQGFIATLVTGFVIMTLTPFVGHWSDKVGRIRIMLVAGVLFLCTVYPAFAFMNAHASLATMMVVMLWVGALKAVYFAPIPALMSSLFPTRTRATGMAVGYNLGTTIFGGFTPLAVAWLIAATGNKLAPGLYLMVGAVISLTTLLIARTRMGAR